MAKKPTIEDPSINLDEELPPTPEPSDSPEEPADVEAQPEGTTPTPPAKKPTPGDGDYDWSVHYGTSDLYIHTYADGQVVALRRFKDIYSKQWLRSIRNLQTDFDIESAAIDRASCEIAKELIDNRPCPVGGADDFADLFKAWQSADVDGGVTAGE